MLSLIEGGQARLESEVVRPSQAQPSRYELVVSAHVPGRYVAGTLANVVLFYWIGDGTLEGAQLLTQLIEAQTHGRTRVASAVHLVNQRAGVPDAALRAALVAAMKRYADVTGCLAVVLLGAGFWASALQSALTGIRMLVPSGSSVMRFGASPESLAGWFVAEHAQRTGESLTDEQLFSAIEALRRLGDRSP